MIQFVVGNVGWESPESGIDQYQVEQVCSAEDMLLPVSNISTDLSMGLMMGRAAARHRGGD